MIFQIPFGQKYQSQVPMNTLPSSHLSAKDLVSALLQVDPKKRMTAEQALKHPWISVRLLAY